MALHFRFGLHNENLFQVTITGMSYEVSNIAAPLVSSVFDAFKLRMKPVWVFPRDAILNASVIKTYCDANGGTIEYDAELIEQGKAIRARHNDAMSVIAQLKAEYAAHTPPSVSWDYVPRGPYKALEHQKTMYKAIMGTEMCGILSDAGTCKTASYLWAIDSRLKSGAIKKAMIVTLSPLKQNVAAEAEMQIPGVRCVWVKSTVHMRKVMENLDNYDVVITNYESQRVYREMDLSMFDMVVLDEAHRVGAPGTKQTKAVMDLYSYSAKYRYIVTGSLNANNELSFFMPYRFLSAGASQYGNYYGFRQEYMFVVDKEGRIWRPRPHTATVVQRIVGKFGIGFRKQDCLDLPGVIEQVRSIDMDVEQKTAYHQLEHEMVTIIDDMCSKCTGSTGDISTCARNCGNTVMIEHALVLAGKLRQIACGFMIKTMKMIDDEGAEVDDSQILTIGSNPKLKLMDEVLDEIGDNKVIIWTHWRHTITEIEKHLKKRHDGGVVVVAGSVNVFDAIAKFKLPGVKYFLAMPSKAGIGQNIQFSHYQIWFSDFYSWLQYDQALARQDRQGQEHKVSSYHLVCNNSIDEKLQEVLQHKKELSDVLGALATQWKQHKRA